MNQKMQWVTLIVFVVTVVGLMWGRHQDHQRISDLQEQLKQTMLESAKINRDLARMIETNGFEKCNGDYECQQRYPNALKAVEAAEAAESRELEKKSTYEE